MLFKDSGIEITTEGKRHLGAVIGSDSFKAQYITEKVKEWVDDITQLAKIAESEPQAAYAAYIFGLSHRWTFYMRTIEGTKDFLQPIEDAIAHTLIPSIIGKRVSQEDRNIMALPIRWGGMGINNPVECADLEYKRSLEITKPLVDLIKAQKPSLLELDLEQVSKLKAETRIMKNIQHKIQSDRI